MSGRRPRDEPTRPLTLDRVGTFLRGSGYAVVQDEDGDLTGTWDGDRFWFVVDGEQDEVLQVRGRWHRTLPEERRTAALLAVNDWNRERIWPKVYLRQEGDRTAVYTETATDLSHGATDAQLGRLVMCGLGTGVQLFAALEGLVTGGSTSGGDAEEDRT